MALTFAFGPYTLDSTRRRLLREGEVVSLTPKAFDVLCILVERSAEVVTKEELLDAAWPGVVVDEGNLAFQVSAIRKALLEKSDGARYIATIPGRGYQFVAPVERVASTDIVIEEWSSTTFELEESERSPETTRRAVPLVAFLVIALGVVAALTLPLLRRASPAPAEPARTIAVLPFHPIVENDRDEALELGMADALIARISGIDGVIVRPLTSVRRFADGDVDPVEAGRALGVDAVLDGSIHIVSDRIRVRARLLQVSDSRQLWQESFDDRLSGIFQLQDSISHRIVTALAWKLSPEDERHLASRATANLDAYREYATGRLFWARARQGDLRTAIEHFERATSLDPLYADAWASLASSSASLAIATDERPRIAFVLARDAAEMALSIDPDSAEAHAALAATCFWYLWDWDTAEAEAIKAVSLNPGDAYTKIRYAHLLSNLGRHEESRMMAAEARGLEPLSPPIVTFSAQFLLQEGKIEEGTRMLHETLELAPDFWLARLNLGKAYEYAGRHDDALVEFRRALELSGPNGEALMMIGYVQTLLGNDAESRKILDGMLEAAKDRYVPPTRIALLYVGLGDHDQAFAWLDRACEEHDPGLTFLYANPRWKRLESDSRFERIRQCVNLPAWP